MQRETISPGHYDGLANERYHASAGISKSHLDTIAVSPLHYYDKHIAPYEPIKKTPALILGDAIHTAVLEPQEFENRHIVQPKLDLRTSAGKAAYQEWVPQALGRVILSQDDFDTARRVRDAVHAHPQAGPLFRGGAVEQTYYAIDQETGELIKCRIDYEIASAAMMVDFKTTENAAEHAFGKSAAKYRYDVQGGWYPHVKECLTGERTETFVFVAAEKERPWPVGIYYMSEDDFVFGLREAKNNLNQIIDAKRTGLFPDYATHPKPINFPKWYRDRRRA